jgi:ElaB/YqjD/DUF883 family membrane-anchored ribosome-binding protein
MPDDKCSEGIQHEGKHQAASSKVVAPQAPPSALAGPPAQGISQKRMEGAIHAVEDRVKRAEWLMIGLTAGIVLLTLGLVIVGILQWSAMRGQLHEMQSSSGQTDQLIAKTGILADNAGKQADRTKELTERMKDQADRTKELVAQAKVSANAATSAANTAGNALTVGNRPWVKITHRIVQPLTFGFRGASGPAATMRVEDTIENVGQTIALNVLAWEDVIPEDYEFPPGQSFALPTDRAAVIRQHEWCDANRNSDQSRTVGNILFPHSPMVQVSTMGPSMSTVNNSLSHSPVKGKVSFVMVGCVCYRSSFENPRLPNHQTRFIYRLGIPQSFGGWYPFVAPEGTASELQLIADFDTFAAD